MIVRSTIIIVVVLRSKTKEAQSWLRYAQQLYPFGISWLDQNDRTIISRREIMENNYLYSFVFLEYLFL